MMKCLPVFASLLQQFLFSKKWQKLNNTHNMISIILEHITEISLHKYVDDSIIIIHYNKVSKLY